MKLLKLAYGFCIFATIFPAFGNECRQVDPSSLEKFNHDLSSFVSKMIVLSDKMSPAPKYILIAPYETGNGDERLCLKHRIFYGDGTRFQQLYLNSIEPDFGNSNEQTKAEFFDPIFNRSHPGNIVFSAGQRDLTSWCVVGNPRFFMNGVPETEIAQIKRRAVFSPIPKQLRVTQYLFHVVNSENYVYADLPKDSVGWSAFRVFFGSVGKMTQKSVVNVTRFTDGGTTIVDMADGTTLFVPTPWEPFRRPLWNNEPVLEAIDQRFFDLRRLGISDIPTQMSTPCETATTDPSIVTLPAASR